MQTQIRGKTEIQNTQSRQDQNANDDEDFQPKLFPIFSRLPEIKKGFYQNNSRDDGMIILGGLKLLKWVKKAKNVKSSAAYIKVKI